MKSIAHYRKKYAAEIKRLSRFAVVGLTSTFLYAGMYALLSRLVWRDGNHTVENVIATAFASVFNFYANRHWTFCRPNELPGTHLRHVRRYILVVVVAAGIQSFLFWLAHETLHIYDFLVIILLTGIMPFFTYASHRWFTFAPPRDRMV